MRLEQREAGSSSQCPGLAISLAQRAMHPALVE
jgi:hypothetical protein